MEKKYNLKIVRADDTSALNSFRCGVPSMDLFIHDRENGLAKFIKLRLSNLWIVYENDEVVAFFALSKDALMLNSEDRRTIERDKDKAATLASPEDKDMFWEKEKYPAVEIDYFAVCEERRKEEEDHLGTYLIELIGQRAAHDELSATLFLTVEALNTREYSAVKFYRKCDFEFSDVAQNRYNYEIMYGNQPITKRMYKLIIPIEY